MCGLGDAAGGRGCVKLVLQAEHRGRPVTARCESRLQNQAAVLSGCRAFRLRCYQATVLSGRRAVRLPCSMPARSEWFRASAPVGPGKNSHPPESAQAGWDFDPRCGAGAWTPARHKGAGHKSQAAPARNQGAVHIESANDRAAVQSRQPSWESTASHWRLRYGDL